jgi:hypothetical protein
VDVDFRGSVGEVEDRLRAEERAAAAESSGGQDAVPRGPGRPRLGVVSKEVTLRFVVLRGGRQCGGQCGGQDDGEDGGAAAYGGSGAHRRSLIGWVPVRLSFGSTEFRVDG